MKSILGKQNSESSNYMKSRNNVQNTRTDPIPKHKTSPMETYSELPAPVEKEKEKGKDKKKKKDKDRDRDREKDKDKKNKKKHDKSKSKKKAKGESKPKPEQHRTPDVSYFEDSPRENPMQSSDK